MAYADSLRKRLASATAELERHPPPANTDCAHTLGATRFGALFEDLGSIRAGLGDYTGAIDAYTSAIACSPRGASLYADLASELLNVGRLKEAREAARHGLAIDSEQTSLDSVLAQIDFIEEHWADAVARLRAVATAESDDQRATYWQCFLWLAQRRAGTRSPELAARKEYEEWPAHVLDALKNDITEAELVGVIRKQEDEGRRREMLAEALYYMGQLRLANGDAATARRYFAATVSLKVLYFIEHHMALAEIAKARAATDQY